MAKKYLSLEEAAEQLGLAPAELVKLREAGELHGFADRGTWKFRADAINEYARSQEVGSHPDIQMFESEADTDEDLMVTGDDSGLSDGLDLNSSDSDVRLMLDDSLAPDLGSDPEISLPGGESLSDVRLTGDDLDLGLGGSDSDVQLVGGSDSDVVLDVDSDSDSDVAIIGAISDSDVKVIETDSDLRLPGLDDSDSDIRVPGTDIDVPLTATQDSDSDINLISDTDGDLDLLSSDSDVSLIVSEDGSAVTLEIDGEEIENLESASSLILDPGDAGSGISLESGDSGVNLGAVDSGISLESIDSGIALDADSGISLEAADSGISLEAADSGISLDVDSGISLEDADSGISLDNDVSQTMPMQALDSTDFSEADKTQAVPTMETSSEFELAGLDDDDDEVGSDTSVLLFDDESASDAGETAAELSAVSSAVTDTSDEVDEFEDDEFEEGDEFDDDGFEDEGDDELLGVDDDAFEGDFEDDAEDGEYEAAAATAGVSRGAEYDWGTWPFVGLCLSTLLMTGCFLVGFDLIRSMWAHSEPAASGWLLNMLGGLFG
jgi:hypothetical protein